MRKGLINRNPRGGGILDELYEEGVIGIGAAVLALAVYDWVWPSSWQRRRVKRRGFNSLFDEILDFWHSPWGIFLRDGFGLADLDIESLRRKGGDQNVQWSA